MKRFATWAFRSCILFISVLTISIVSAQIKLTDKIPTAPDVKIGKLSNGLTYYIKKNVKPEKKLNCVWL